MKKALLLTLLLFTGCAPFSGISGASIVSVSSARAVESVSLTPEGEAMLLMKLDQRYEKQE